MSDTNKPLVLIIDDEPQIRRLLHATLDVNGFRVLAAANGQEGLVLATQHRPAVVILDLGLPDLSGQEVLRRLRDWSNLPVVILSVQDDEAGKVAALNAGADDFVTKPFNSAELLARLRVALRHASKQEEAAVFQVGNLVVDLATRRVTVKGREVKLTVKEYDLLRLLVRHAGKVLTHRQIVREVWETPGRRTRPTRGHARRLQAAYPHAASVAAANTKTLPPPTSPTSRPSQRAGRGRRWSNF